MNWDDKNKPFTKADAILVDRHQSDRDKLDKHNLAIQKARDDDKERIKRYLAAQEALANARARLETEMQASGDACRRLELSVPEELRADASQAAQDARHATKEALQVEGYVATCRLTLERMRPLPAQKDVTGGRVHGIGADEQSQKAAQERLARTELDLAEARERVKKSTEKALRLELQVEKAKEAILAHARRAT
jgi:hypothetical protein